MNRTARILAIVLALVLVGGGIYAAYETGFDNGAAVAAQSGDDSGSGTVVVHETWRGGYGWHGGFGHGGFGFFPIFPILFFLLVFGVFRPWRGGPGRGWNGREANWGGGWGPPREAMEQRMKEWHQQAHNEGDADRPRS